MNTSKFLYKRDKKGKIINYKSFTSCGTSEAASFINKSDKNILLIIKVKDAPIISDFADGIKIRGYAKEELLLLRNRKFKVDNIEEIDNNYLIHLIEK